MSRKREEPVRLTRIYTRGGDHGETSLGDGTRVAKTNPRVEAMGDVDELNSLIGWALAAEGAPDLLRRIQNELFDLGADLATPESANRTRLRVSHESIERLESECDTANSELEPLRSFVLPGGSELAARLYLGRAVCRRAERSVLRVEGANPAVAVYLNRLSDLLFILARAANEGSGEPLWKPGATESA
ncbi:MAG TPA: cob(I)yrinic acid a,c-diamide adenosyltransferase [Gaiellaceae bacterium]|jgi:cob(I)alamin adenosyltransferase|nr:cob(I)yrinic acid a,c-diamide adenosyltransferase [Gaiellaceae bacterium]